MGAQGKMLRSKRHFTRCRIAGHGQDCGIIDEMRPVYNRSMDKREWKHEVQKEYRRYLKEHEKHR